MGGSRPKTLATLQFSRVADALRLEMPQLVAVVAERHAVAHLVDKFWVPRDRLDVVRPKIPASIIAAVLTGIIIASKDRATPFAIFWGAPEVEVALGVAMFIGVMVFTAGGLLAGSVPGANRCALFGGSRSSTAKSTAPCRPCTTRRKTRSMAKPVPIPGGLPCPKCKRPMQRCEHKPWWCPKPGHYFYRYWDKCHRCRHLQHYEAAKVLPTESRTAE